eukprot:CAMPEP_0181443644 /NCGR_PEP_ID=MMETSP1110-20121109/24658_1 /TAXON_ID=174948 /ORGANISM="Symbiodinium sp., Strain CCMP421" /LENGTH=34 /DNA_ID= /DNA_START= /DNA_END= /DNA_ORIENTATION=
MTISESCPASQASKSSMQMGQLWGWGAPLNKLAE